MFGDAHSRRQGDLGEAAAIDWLTRQGADVLVPLFHSPDYDLAAEVEGDLLACRSRRLAIALPPVVPAGALECRSAVTLGGPKYAIYEVDRGRSRGPPSLDSHPLRGDTRAVKGAAL